MTAAEPSEGAVTAPSPADSHGEPADLDRYARQVMLDGFGARAQRALAHAAVLVVGAGGLGAPVLTYLAAGGVGRLGIADADIVTATNLARQVLFGPADLDAPKADRASARLAALNPAVETVVLPCRVTPANCREIIGDFDVVVDATDNLATRLLLNRETLRAGKTYVWGAIAEYAGRAGVAVPGQGPCFACLFPEADAVPPDRVLGVYGPICAVIGGWMAGEAMAVAGRIRPAATGALVEVDLRFGTVTTIAVKPDKACPVCGSLDEIH